MKSIKLPAIFLVVTFCFIGCAGSSGLQNISRDYDINMYPNKAIIIGKNNIEWEGTIGIPTLQYIIIYDNMTQKRAALPIGDEFFVISIEEGEYTIDHAFLGFGILGVIGNGYPAHINRKFKINRGEIVYIGNLTVTYKWVFKAFQGTSGPFTRISIIDDFENATKEFGQKFPNIKFQVVKRLIKELL